MLQIQVSQDEYYCIQRRLANIWEYHIPSNPMHRLIKLIALVCAGVELES